MTSRLRGWLRAAYAELKNLLFGDEIRAALVGAVIGAIVASAGSWAVAQHQIDAQDVQAQRAIDAQKAQELREKKAVVYSDFMEAAQGWADTRMQQVFCNCVPSQDLFEAYSDFRRQDLNVGIFGSDDARDAAEKVVRAIPDNWFDNDKGGTVHRSKPFDLNVYADAANSFVHVMCTELPVTPNDRC